MIRNFRRIFLESLMASAGAGLIPVWAKSNSSVLRPVDMGDTELPTLESGSGPVILLVHGANADMRFWWPVTESLRDKFTILSYNLRGHDAQAGRHAKQTRNVEGYLQYSLLQHAADLATLTKKMFPVPVHLVGHDFGANVAMLAAALHPGIASSITISNPSELGLVFEDPGFRKAVAEDRQLIDLIGRNLADARAARAYDLFLKRYVGSESHFLPTWTRAMFQSNARCLPMLLKMYRDNPALDESRLSRLNIPVNLISGAFGRDSSRAINDILAARFAKAPHALIPGGYLAPILNPVGFSQAVHGFIAKLPAIGSMSRT